MSVAFRPAEADPVAAAALAAHVLTDASDAELAAAAALLVPRTQLTGMAINVRDTAYGVTADGVTDDLTGLVAANAAAAAAGKALWMPRGAAPYLISNRWTPTVPVFSDWATIKKAATFPATSALRINGTADMQIHNLKIDGNRAAGALGTGIIWTGAGATGGRLVNCWVTQNKGVGVQCDTSAELDVLGSKASYNVTGTGLTFGTGHGFYAVSSGVLRLRNCTAEDNDGSGAFFDTTAGAGCYVDLRSRRNLRAGLTTRNSDGKVAVLTASYNNRWGWEGGNSTVVTNSSNWESGPVLVDHTGSAFTNAAGSVPEYVSGAAFAGYGLTRYQGGPIVSRDQTGYGMALTSDGTGGSTKCHLSADITATGGDGDPALHISGSSTENVVEVACDGTTLAVSFGEQNNAGRPDDNIVKVRAAVNCAYAILFMDAGANNTIRIEAARDCYTVQPETYPGLITFTQRSASYPTSGNKVIFDIDTHRTISNPAPAATTSETGGATGNVVSA